MKDTSDAMESKYRNMLLERSGEPWICCSINWIARVQLASRTK